MKLSFGVLCVCLLLSILSVCDSKRNKLASVFVRESLSVQQDIARKVLVALGVDKVCVFDGEGSFVGGEDRVVERYRYIWKDEKIAVLSVVAQKVFPSANTYVQYSDSRVVREGLSVFVVKD